MRPAGPVGWRMTSPYDAPIGVHSHAALKDLAQRSDTLPEIPVSLGQYAVSFNAIPCYLGQRIGAKTLQLTGIWPHSPSLGDAKTADSLKNSLFAGKMAGDGCDRHCVASVGVAIELPHSRFPIPSEKCVAYCA